MLPHIETSQLICTENQLTGFCMRATLTLNGLSRLDISRWVLLTTSFSIVYRKLDLCGVCFKSKNEKLKKKYFNEYLNTLINTFCGKKFSCFFRQTQNFKICHISPSLQNFAKIKFSKWPLSECCIGMWIEKQNKNKLVIKND